MSGHRRRTPAALALLAGALLPLPARALDTPELAGHPVHLDVTEATSVYYNVGNRNSQAADVARRLDDDWGVWYNRLNAQASWKSFQAGLRLDSAWFYAAPHPTDVGLDLLRDRHGGTLPSTYTSDDAQFFVLKTTQASRELATRYTDWLYPSKYYVGYTGRTAEVTVGDFYAQLGRGFVLSVRKLDELASDTTIRGGRGSFRLREGDFRFRATALGGSLNPLRLDEASGRYLGVTAPSGLENLFEAGMPRAQASPFDAAASPTYSPDRVVAAQLEGGTRIVQIGVQGSVLNRTLVDRDGTPGPLSPGVVRSAENIRTGSVSVNFPDLDGHGAAYVEVAGQSLGYPGALDRAGSALPGGGHAVYASITAIQKPVTVTAEARHDRRFFPLAANVDLARAPEFSAVQYSAPPTTEAIWTDTEYESFATCVSGGRLKTDVALSSHATVFAWVARYLTWAESVTNEQCSTNDANRNRVWDLATGLEVTSRDRRSRGTVTAGTRFDDTDRLIDDPNGGQTHVFYRELYARYEVIESLGGPFTLKLQGWNRRRHQTLGGQTDPWLELQQLVGLDVAPRFTFGAGFEYTGNTQFPPTYFNGTIGYNLSSSSNISLFAGQRRGGLRCVSGVCRVYPPFEGVRVDATFRF